MDGNLATFGRQFKSQCGNVPGLRVGLSRLFPLIFGVDNASPNRLATRSSRDLGLPLLVGGELLRFARDIQHDHLSADGRLTLPRDRHAELVALDTRHDVQWEFRGSTDGCQIGCVAAGEVLGVVVQQAERFRRV